MIILNLTYRVCYRKEYSKIALLTATLLLLHPSLIGSDNENATNCVVVECIFISIFYSKSVWHSPRGLVGSTYRNCRFFLIVLCPTNRKMHCYSCWRVLPLRQNTWWSSSQHLSTSFTNIIYLHQINTAYICENVSQFYR